MAWKSFDASDIQSADPSQKQKFWSSTFLAHLFYGNLDYRQQVQGDWFPDSVVSIRKLTFQAECVALYNCWLLSRSCGDWYEFLVEHEYIVLIISRPAITYPAECTLRKPHANEFQLTMPHSRKDKNAAQPPVGRRTEAWLAAIWEGVVCRMYDSNNRELAQSWYSYVSPMFDRKFN